MQEKNSPTQSVLHSDERIEAARPQVIATRQALTQRRGKSSVNSAYVDGKSIRQATRSKKIPRSHARNQEIETPKIEISHQHESKWTMYKELRSYLSEIIKKKIDKDTLKVLVDGLDYHTKIWVLNDHAKNRQLALHGLSYLAENNVKLLDDKDKLAQIIKIINETLTIYIDKVHKNIIEYALMTLSYLIIQDRVQKERYVYAIQNGIVRLTKNNAALNIYYPPIIVALYAKTLAGKALSAAEVILLQQTCIYISDREDLQKRPNFFVDVIKSEKYVPDPMIYYSNDADYYKNKRLFGEGEIKHLIDLLHTGKFDDEMQRCKFIHALLNAVTNGQQIPDNYQKKLLGVIQESNHHKSGFYSCLLLGALLRSAKFQCVNANLDMHAIKIHEMLSLWRGYALKAYHKHLSIQKESKLPKIDYDDNWRSIIEYWSKNENKLENKKYVTLILHAVGDVTVLGRLSIEPKHCTSTLTIWLDSVANKKQLSISVLHSITIILSDPENKGYDDEHKELALYLLSSLLEGGKIPERLFANDQNSILTTVEAELATLFKTVSSFVVANISSPHLHEKLLDLSLEILEAQAEYHYNFNLFNNSFITSLSSLLCQDPADVRQTKLRVSSLFERILEKGDKSKYENIFGYTENTQARFIVALNSYNKLAQHDTDSKDTRNNILLCLKHAAAKSYGLNSFLLEKISDLMITLQDESTLFILIDTFKIIVEQNGQESLINIKILSNLFNLLSKDHPDVPPSVCYIICSLIKKWDTQKQKIHRDFYQVFNNKIFYPTDAAKRQQCLYYGIEILELLTEKKHQIAPDTLIYLNNHFSTQDYYIRSKIIDIDLRGAQDYPFYSKDILLALQRYDDTNKSLLEDQLTIIGLMIAAKDDTLKLVDLSDNTCIVAVEAAADNDNPYTLKKAALQLLVSGSKYKLFPKDLIFELTLPLKQGDSQIKKMILSVILNQLTVDSAINFHKMSDDDEKLFLTTIEGCIIEEELADLTIRILIAACANHYTLPSHYLNTLVNIIFTHQKSQTRGMAVKLLMMQKSTNDSKRVAEVKELEGIAEAFKRGLTLLQIQKLHQCVKEGRQLTLNVLEGIEGLLSDNLALIQSNDEAVLEMICIVKALISAQCDFATRWVDLLVKLVATDSRHAKEWVHALSLLLICQSISQSQPFLVVSNFVINNTTDLIEYHMLEALCVGSKIYDLNTIIPRPSDFLYLLLTLIQDVNDRRTYKLRTTAINLMGYLALHTNAYRKLSKDGVNLLEGLLRRYLESCNKFDVTIKLFEVIAKIKLIDIDNNNAAISVAYVRGVSASGISAGSNLKALIEEITRINKDLTDFHNPRIHYKHRLDLLTNLLRYEPFKRSHRIYEEAASQLLTKGCSGEIKDKFLLLLDQHTIYIQFDESVLIAVIEALSTCDQPVVPRKTYALAHRVALKIISRFRNQLSDNFFASIIVLLKSASDVHQCIYLADILKKVAKNQALPLNSAVYSLANFYNDMCEFSLSDRQEDHLVKQINDEALLGLAPIIVDILFDLFSNGRLSESLLSETIKRCYKSLSAKSKFIVLNRCFQMADVAVTHELFKTSLKEYDSSYRHIHYTVSSLTLKQMDLLLLMYQRADFPPSKNLITDLIKRLINCYKSDEQVALANILKKVSQYTGTRISANDINELLCIVASSHQESIVVTQSTANQLWHGFQMCLDSIDATYKKLSSFSKVLSQGQQFNVQVKNLVIRVIYQSYNIDPTVIQNLNKAYVTLLLYAKDIYSESTLAVITKQLSILSSESKFSNLTRLLAFEVKEQDIITIGFLANTIKEKLVKQLDKIVDPGLLNLFITRYEGRRTAQDGDLLLLLDVLSARIQENAWQRKHVNAVLKILQSPLILSESRINPVAFVNQCDDDVLSSWFKVVLSLYPGEPSSDELSLQQLADLVANIGFDHKSFERLISKIPFEIRDKDNATKVKRSEIIKLMQFIRSSRLEAHFLTSILPTYQMVPNYNPIANWLAELKQQFFYLKIVRLKSLIEKFAVPIPVYEALIDVAELAQKILLLIDKDIASFGECVGLIGQFEAALTSYKPQSDQGVTQTYLSMPNLARLSYTIDFSINHQQKLIAQSQSLHKYHHDYVKANFDLNDKDLPPDELCRQLININQNTDSKIKIADIIHKIQKVINLSNELAVSSNVPSSAIEKWDKGDIQSWAARKMQQQLTESDRPEIVAVLTRACKLIRKVDVWHTQLIALLFLIDAPASIGRFLQVATGEGKSTILAMVAIWHVLHRHTVDIVTSSPILAARDANDLKPLYECFNINISHNDEDPNYLKGTKSCYEDHIAVVYGSASNFQFDILRHEYSFLETRGKRGFDIIIIDEVDNLLIDEGSKIAMLANTMPFFSYLNPLLIAIYKELERIDLNFRYHDNELFYHDAKSAVQLPEEKIANKELKITEILKKYAQQLITKSSKSFICIPHHLEDYVRRQIDPWVRSAILAYYVYQPNHHYIIVQDSNFIDRITPVDYSNTGITQNGTTWGDGLQQFLEIKHGLKISPESIITNYLSNVAFIKRYIKHAPSNANEVHNHIYGITGTLGSEDAKALLGKIYDLDFVNIPTFRNRKFKAYPPQVCDNSDSWLANITLEAIREASMERVVLVLCETIVNAEMIAKVLEHYKADLNVIKYIVSDSKTALFSEEYQPRTIIVATNLAGRGTDIQLARNVITNGGLHVIFTFLPDNLRVERQGFGRAARKGQPGTGKYIVNRDDLSSKLMIMHSNENEHVKLDDFAAILAKRDQNESQLLKKIEVTELPVIENKDLLFSNYRHLIEDLKPQLKTGILDSGDSNWFDGKDFETVKDAIEERWGLWLKSLDFSVHSKKVTQDKFNEFSGIIRSDLRDNTVIKNPCYYINLGNRIASELDSWLLKSIYAHKNSVFCRYAIASYDRAIQLDPRFSFTAYYNRSFIKLYSQTQNHKPESMADLSKASHFIKQMSAQLEDIGKIYSNNQSRGIKHDLAMQLLHEKKVLDMMLSSIKEILDTIENQNKYLSLTVNDNKATHIHKRLSKKSAHDVIISNSTSNSSAFDVSFHDLHPRHDVGVASSAEEIINSLKTQSQCDVSFDIAKLVRQPTLQFSLRKLLPINQYLNGDVEPDSAKKDKPEEQPKESITFGKILRKGGGMIAAIPTKIDDIYQAGAGRAQDWYYEKHTYRTIPVTLIFSRMSSLRAVEILKLLITSLDEAVRDSKPEVYVIYEKDAANSDLSKLQVLHYLKTYTDTDEFTVTVPSERGGVQKYDDCSDGFRHSAIHADGAKKYRLTLKYSKYQKLIDSLIPQSGDSFTFSMKINRLPQIIADKLIRFANADTTLSFSEMSPKSASAIVYHCDYAIASAVLSVKGLNNNVAYDLVDTSEPSKRVISALPRPLELVLINEGFEKADIDSFYHNGYLLFYQAYQKQLRPIRRILIKAGFGAIQLAGGVALSALTMGFGAAVGGVFIAEGLGDLFSAAIAYKKGEMNFDGYVGNKLFNIGIGVALIGVGKVIGVVNTARNTAKGLAAGAEMAEVGMENISALTKLSSFFTGGTHTLSGFAKTGARFAAKKIILTTANSGIGTGTEMFIENYRAKVESQMRMIVKTQISNPHCKSNLAKIFAYDRLQGLPQNNKALQNLIEIKINQLNFTLSAADQDAIELAFETLFTSSCEELAANLKFKDLLQLKLLGGRLHNKDILAIIDTLKEHGILRQDDSINLEKLVTDKDDIQPNGRPDFTDHTIDFKQHKSLKNDILSICLDTGRAAQLDYFSETNNLIKLCSNQISHQIMNEVMIATTVGQMVASMAVSVGYSYAEAALISQYEDWQIRQQGGKIEDIDQEYKLTNRPSDFKKEITRLQAVRRVTYPEVTSESGEKFTKEKIYFKNGATLTRLIKSEESSLVGKLPLEINLEKDDIANLLKGYSLSITNYRTHSSVSDIIRDKASGNDKLVMDSKLSVWSYNSQIDTNSFSKSIDVVNVQFIYDSLTCRYVQTTRDSLHRHRFNKANTNFSLVRDKDGQSRLNVTDDNFAIRVNPETRGPYNQLHSHESLWAEFSDMLSDIAENGPRSYVDSDRAVDPINNVVAQDYNAIKSAIEQAKGERLSQGKGQNSLMIRYNCFLERVNLATQTLYRYLTLQHATHQAFLMKLNYDEMLVTWSHAYDDTLFHVEQIIQLLITVIIANLGELLKHDVEAFATDDDFLAPLRENARKCFHDCMTAGYAEQSYAIFLSYLEATQRDYDSLKGLIEHLKGKFIDYHNLRYQLHRIETLYNFPSFSSGLFKGMKREQLDRAVQSLSGLMIRGQSYQVGMIFQQGTESPFGAAVGGILATIDIKINENQYAKERMEKFLGNLIMECQHHEAIIQQVQRSNQAVELAIKREHVRVEAEKLIANKLHVESVLNRISKKEVSDEQMQEELDNLNKMTNDCRNIINQYHALINSHSGHILTSLDKHLLEHTKAIFLISRSMLKAIAIYQKSDLMTGISNILIPPAISSPKEQHICDDKAKPAPQTAVTRPAINFKYTEALRQAYASILASELPKIAVLLRDSNASSLIDLYPPTSRMIMTPVNILDLTIATEAIALTLYQTVSSVCHSVNNQRPAQNVAYLSFATKLGYSGIVTALGITRQEIRKILLAAIRQKDKVQADSAIRCVQTGIKKYLNRHLRLGCNFERAYQKANIHIKWQMLDTYSKNWADGKAVLANLTKLTQLLMVEFNKLDKTLMSESELTQWNANDDVKANIKLLDKYITNKNTVHELYLIYGTIEAKLEDAFVTLVGNSDQSRHVRRLEILLDKSGQQPWPNISALLVGKYCQDNRLDLPRDYHGSSSRSLQELLDDKTVIESFIVDYLSQDYSELDQTIYNLIMSQLNLSVPKISQGDDVLQTLRGANQEIVITLKEDHNDEQLTLHCKCTKEHIDLFNSLALPLNEIDVRHPIYHLRKSLITELDDNKTSQVNSEGKNPKKQTGQGVQQAPYRSSFFHLRRDATNARQFYRKIASNAEVSSTTLPAPVSSHPKMDSK